MKKGDIRKISEKIFLESTSLLWISILIFFILFLFDYYFSDSIQFGDKFITDLLYWIKITFSGEELPIFFIDYTPIYIFSHNLLQTIKLLFYAGTLLLAMTAFFIIIRYGKKQVWINSIISGLSFFSNIHPIYYCILIYIAGVTRGLHWSMIFVLMFSGGLFINFYRQIENAYLSIIQSDYMVALKVFGEKPVNYLIRPMAASLIVEVKSIIPLLLTYTLFIEYFFNIQGIGRLLQLSFQHQATQVICNLSLLVLLFVTILNMAMDLLYYLINPLESEL